MGKACARPLVFRILRPLDARASPGCAVPIRVASVAPEVPRDVPPIAIRSSLDALNDVDN